MNLGRSASLFTQALSMMLSYVPERARGYLIAVLTVSLAVMARFGLNPFLGTYSPLLIFTLPVVVTALYGGYGPALMATALGAFVGVYFFVGGVGWPALTVASATGLVLFLLIGLSVSFLGGRLQASRQSLVDASRRKDDFLAMLGHELRNPLASISAAAELLRRASKEEGSADEGRTGGIDRQASVDVIRRQVGHMARLIDDLLDVTRIARGHVVLTKSQVNVHQVLHDAVEQMRPLIEQKRHALSLLEAGQPMDLSRPQAVSPQGSIEAVEVIEVMGDHARLVQVLANILMNAAKYTPPGGKLQMSLDVQGAWVKIQVSDNGVGISADLLPHIFEYFVQAERTADRAEGGLGLGLPLVKNVVAMHGGRVAVQSKGPGEGSTFTVLLPRLSTLGGRTGYAHAEPASSPTSASVPATSAATASRHKLGHQPGRPARGAALAVPMPEPDQAALNDRGLRILVVDDNADAAVSLGQLLEAYGHAVTVAFDAEQALKMAQVSSSHGFDVALLDIGLPGLNGYQLAERLRRLPQLATCMLLALTGYGTAADSDRSRQAGFDHHLVKPLDLDKLFGLISDREPVRPLQ